MAARVAEYQIEDGGSVLYRVTGARDHGIVYVRLSEGGLSAETFGGRPLAEVPADARRAVERYGDPRGQLW